MAVYKVELIGVPFLEGTTCKRDVHAIEFVGILWWKQDSHEVQAGLKFATFLA